MLSFDDLLPLPNRDLHALLQSGHPIDPASLDDTAYRGTSLGLPAFVDRLLWKTFQKTFHRDPATGVLRGWNVRVEQRGLGAPTVPQRKGDKPVTFGHYLVVPAEGISHPVPCPHGLLLDYGRGGNARLDPTATTRDLLVAVNPGSSDLLLGWMYMDFGINMKTPSFFILEREGPLDHRAEPPRRIALA
jgi:hypothetical protein